MQVAAVRTPTTIPTVRDIISRNYDAIVGEPIGHAMPYLLALFALENAHGKSVFNNNIGNITINSGVYWLAPGDPNRKFGHYDTLDTGVKAWLKRLTSKTHRRMLDAAQVDDFDAFLAGYRTPSPITGMVYCDTCSGEAVENSMRQLVEKFKAELPIVEKIKDNRAGAISVMLMGGFLTAFYMLQRKFGA